jgi:ATP-dependent DNA ligase
MTPLSIRPPLEPMLARLARELPRDGYVYEPKWDGFRCLAFRDGDEIELRSRNQRSLGRYFPEVVEALRHLPAGAFVVDGEIVVETSGASDFEALLRRLHPAASRVQRLSAETPATFIAFDLVALGSEDLRRCSFLERRRRLAELLASQEWVYLTPLTEDAEEAAGWLSRYQGTGIDGVVAKHRDLRYEPGVRAMVKVKPERTADCVVGGFRVLVDRALPSSLLLGLHDEEGALRHVGIVSAFSESRRRTLLEEIVPYVVDLTGHPWQGGFLLAGSPTGKLPGAAGRWSPGEMTQDWIPLAPRLVCEVAFDHADGHRLRHPARFRRWRPDLDPRRCTLEQLETPAASLAELLPPTPASHRPRPGR